MTKMHPAVQQFIDYLHTPIQHASELKRDSTAFQDPVIGNFLQYAMENSQHVDDILSLLSETLKLNVDIYKKGLVTLLCGSLIESGGNPDIIVNDITRQLESHLASTETFLTLIQQEDLDEENLTSNQIEILMAHDSNAVKAAFTVPLVVLATMTSICRTKEARKNMRNNTPLIQQIIQLEDDVENLPYLRQVLHSVDDFEMIILHPESQTGLKVRAEMIQNNFHFFTLLQDQYISEFGLHPSFSGLLRNEVAIQFAKGEWPQIEETINDHALFGFYDFYALNEENNLPPSVPIGNWLFGEGTLYHIPKWDGLPIVLIGENMLGDRSWDISFCSPVHEAIKPKLEVLEVYKDGQVQAYLEQIKSSMTLL